MAIIGSIDAARQAEAHAHFSCFKRPLPIARDVLRVKRPGHQHNKVVTHIVFFAIRRLMDSPP
jgi:hypothetical protein